MLSVSRSLRIKELSIIIIFLIRHADPSAIPLLISDISVNKMIRLEWSQEPLAPYAMQSFSLTVSSGSDSQYISGLNESYYHFTAPEGAPPCEVYNFSVTATHVGATYTGAGCSVPSPLLSTMLPSLPNISQLDSSLEFVVEKGSFLFVVEVSFQVRLYHGFVPMLIPRF